MFNKALELDPDNQVAKLGLKGLEASAEAAKSVFALMTDHYEAEIERPAEVLWGHLKKLYVDGERYRQRGLTVQKITDDATAHLGAYMHAQAQRVRKLICRYASPALTTIRFF